MKLPVIPHDKAQHFIYGAVIALAVTYASMALGLNRELAKLSGLGAAIVVGAIKEYIIDRRASKAAAATNGEPVPSVSSADLVATALGGFLVWLA